MHSLIEFQGDGKVFLATDFVRKDEKKDERVDRILDMIEKKHDWSNHVWRVQKTTSSEFEEADEEEEEGNEEEEGEEGEEGEEQVGHTEIVKSSDISGRNKRKYVDRGAESRKKKVLCELAASSKVNIDTDMKKFLEGLLQASFTTFEKKISNQFSDIVDKFQKVVTDRLTKIETDITQLKTASGRTEQFETDVTGRLVKIESEVTQMRTSLLITELAGKSDQPSGPKKIKIDTISTMSKKDTAPSKKKGMNKKELKTDDLNVKLPSGNLTQSSASDLHMDTNELFKNCMKKLSQDTFVKDLDTSKPTIEDSLDWLELPPSLKVSSPRLDDQKIGVAGSKDPDNWLVFVHPDKFEKMTEWQNTRTAIQIGPSILDGELAGRVMSVSTWLKNYEIDALMYIFRERTTLQRWKVDRVAFMTCVFSDLIASDYIHFCKGIKQYNMNPLLLEYGKGELPSHGRTRKLWNVDVDRMYVPVWVNGNHWIALCISFVTRNIQVFDCAGKKRIKEVEAFTHLIPRIVKAVQSLTVQKHLVVSPYTVSYVPMSGLNRQKSHCGVYTIKHIECHALGLDIALVDDDNIWGCRIKTLCDLWEAAHDPELIERMSKYEPLKCTPTEAIEIDPL
ncbi:hypothetical protein Rs2_42029 [Raphanus sativus]|nr:hypothetical protein Rs2_42029 [Raphanus sativus]